MSKILVAATFLLLVAGALVTSTESGLAVPDWPLAFGELFPEMEGGVFYEHGHRLVAGTVALLTLALCLGLLAKEKRVWVRYLGIGAFAAVIAQALLGGATVLWGLPHAVSIAHALLAELFLALAVSLAIVLSPRWHAPGEIRLEEQDKTALKVLAISTLILVYTQIGLGALERHAHAGIAFHLVGAVLLLFVVGRLYQFVQMGYRECTPLRRPVVAMTHALAVQFVLGLATWIGKAQMQDPGNPEAFRIWSSTAHLALGALMLSLAVLLVWRVASARISVSSPAAEKALA